jgi:transcription initiation factor TFIID subunit 2
VDHEVRWYLLKLADMLLRGTEETLPKPKIYLPPPTPVVEAPPTLAIKVKREKTLPPATPTISAPKLKLSFNTGGSTPGASTSKPLPPMRVAPPKGRGSTPVPGSSRPPPPKGQNQNQNQNHKPVSKAVPKSRSGGMASTEYKAAKRLLGELLRNKHAPLFLVPVDPVRDRAPKWV